MLNKLRDINDKLINYYKDNNIEHKKQLKIKSILLDWNAPFRVDNIKKQI